MTLLAIAGMLIELVGFGVAGWSVYRGWAEVADGRSFWRSRSDQPTAAVDAGIAIDMATVARTEVPLPAQATTDEKVDWLIARVSNLHANHEEVAGGLTEEIRQVRSDSLADVSEVANALAETTSENRRETISRLRETGKGLALAVFGLLLQLPSTF
ncbi:hypothetical protein [Rhodococcoides fascians]|uniref:hypothetical protein n=1 Tax=Rhodococcoides fascians TaxID=1828 RepID=UPI00050C228F|nr:hypothetical protein [Rhodococcus fascians]